MSRARIALGGVGTKPWRSPEAEAALVDQPANEANFRKAAEAALRDAKPQSENGFKIELAKRCLTHAPEDGSDHLTVHRGIESCQWHKQIKRHSPIGRNTPRVDGPLKVTGRAQYTSDFHFPGMLYAVPVEAKIANGRIEKFDSAAAEKMPGVRMILHRGNIGKLYRSVLKPDFLGLCDERRPPFADDVIRYYGQYVALVVADTFETAKAAANAVRVVYAAEKPNVDPDLKADDKPAVDSERGDAERRWTDGAGQAQ